MCIKNTLLYILLILSTVASGQNQSAPHELTVNLLSNTKQVYVNGYPATVPLQKAITQRENFQFIEISTWQPFFGWIVPSSGDNTRQTAYQILVASQKDFLLKDSADLWNSGKVTDENSLNISYNGNPLTPGAPYFWKVKTWDHYDKESTFSPIGVFKMADSLSEYKTDRYPIQKQDEYAVKIEQPDELSYFADFGKAAFGRIRVTLYSDREADTVTIHLGENEKEGRVNRSPGASIRYSQYKIGLERGWKMYVITIDPDARNTGPQAVLMPEYIGEVTPFRYCEIEGYEHLLQEKDLIRETAFYPFNDFDSHFQSTDTVLNQVWDISKYSIKATSFAGIYIDGDRERIPYEGDAVINQLSHYCVARDYSMARYSHEYLIKKPTWPTEWILQSVLMAWEDYMYTGNSNSIAHFYEELKAKTLSSLSDERGFISTRTGKVTPEVLQSIHFNGKLRDIVDWPHTGILGLGKEEGGETDGFVFTDINTVVNAFHYRTLILMAQIAEVLGKSGDQADYKKKAARLKRSFNKHLLDKKRGIYVDGIGTDHASLHANMFPLAFGLAPEEHIDSIVKFIRSRGMACSVYGSQFLLDALYNAHDADYGLQLLTSTDERSWYNMIRVGSTITLEAWDNKYKPNQDWNHAWGAAPANLIPRKLMGIEPLEAGFRKISIKPQPSTLRSAAIKHPTIRGDVMVAFDNDPGQSFQLDTTIPPNTSATIYLPFYSRRQTVRVNGESITYRREGNFSIIENIGSGEWHFTVEQ